MRAAELFDRELFALDWPVVALLRPHSCPPPFNAALPTLLIFARPLGAPNQRVYLENGLDVAGRRTGGTSHCPIRHKRCGVQVYGTGDSPTAGALATLGHRTTFTQASVRRPMRCPAPRPAAVRTTAPTRRLPGRKAKPMRAAARPTTRGRRVSHQRADPDRELEGGQRSAVDGAAGRRGRKDIPLWQAAGEYATVGVLRRGQAEFRRQLAGSATGAAYVPKMISDIRRWVSTGASVARSSINVAFGCSDVRR